jgi:hypothetical protein
LYASFLFAKHFGWTPQQVNQLTMAQVNIFLDFLNQNGDK